MGQYFAPCMRQVWVKADIILHMALRFHDGPSAGCLWVNEKGPPGPHRTRRARELNISGRKSGICLIKAMRQEGLRLLWGCLPAIITTRMTLIMKTHQCVGRA